MDFYSLMKIDFHHCFDEPESQFPHRNRYLVFTFVSATIPPLF